ncbi:MAG: peptide chain release factor N(5)-glutamine methyltransferase [Bacteroidales bacterium]|nr:peptide chain release factor N(5)-glutamine methyltransferase [Bacteroidales bacterium]
MNTRNLRFRSNRVRDIVALFHEELDDQYGAAEVGVFVEMLCEAFLGWDKVRLMTSREQTIDQSDLLRFHWALEDLKQSRPIQHIIGYTDFCGCCIAVSPDVLIPRPETEELVNWILHTFHFPLSTFHLLDLCTGSGCIAIALKKAFPTADVTAVDISPKALEMARQNAQNNSVEVRFVQADVLNGVDGLSGSYGLIVSNPPYVCDSERAQMQRNVLDYDPALALFVPDDDPLRFYRAIAAMAREHLSQDGMLVVEINEALAEETSAVFEAAGLAAETHMDFRGKPRWISAQFKNAITK